MIGEEIGNAHVCSPAADLESWADELAQLAHVTSPGYQAPDAWIKDDTTKIDYRGVMASHGQGCATHAQAGSPSRSD